MATRREQEKRRSKAREWAEQQSKGFEPTAVKLPDGVEFLKFTKAGVYKVDFLPYRVGRNNPRADKGTDHFEREYEVHRIPTADGGRLYCCREKCFRKKCAVCDWLKENGGSADPQLTKELRSKTRHLWLVNEEPGNTKAPVLKVFDSNHYNKGKGFGEQMVDVFTSLDEEVEPFVLKGGYTAKLRVIEDSFSGRKYWPVTRIDLEKHDYNYPSSLLDEAPCLDDCLVDPGYDEVMKLLTTGGVDSDDDDDDDGKDEPKRKGSARKDADADDDDDDKEDEDEDHDDPDDADDSDDDGDDEDNDPRGKKKVSPRDDDDEEDPKPAKSPGKSSRDADDDDDDSDEDDDGDDGDEEDNEPPRKKPKGKR